MDERYSSVYESSGKRVLRQGVGRTGAIICRAGQTMMEGEARLRRLNGLHAHERSYERWTSVYERSGEKVLRRGVGRNGCQRLPVGVAGAHVGGP